MTTHRRLVVRVADHEAADPAWRVQHADETISTTVLAYFERRSDGTPVQNPDGTFTVHAPSRDTLDTLRGILTGHEGMTIVSEDEAPGNGVITAR
jgi:hypothetical protein